MKLSKALTLSAAVVAFGFAASVYSSANAQSSALDSVKDARGSFVIDNRGNCVRTKWTENMDDCGNAPAPTPAPAPAPMELSREQRTLYFDFDKDALTADSVQKLNNVVAHVQTSKQVVKANVGGYADEIGENSYNQALSERRARKAAQYLTQRGVNAGVLDVRALGEASSAGQCPTTLNRNDRIQCLWKDRRVEVELNYYK
jgi:OOP family OmpA-OmpF porin